MFSVDAIIYYNTERVCVIVCAKKDKSEYLFKAKVSQFSASYPILLFNIEILNTYMFVK